MGEIIYAAIPKRMMHFVPMIIDEIKKEENFPLVPLHLFRDFDSGNGNGNQNKSKRKETERQIERSCGSLLYAADRLHIYGIGTGSLLDLSQAVRIGKPTKSLVTLYDNEWEFKATRPEYRQFKPILEEILGKETMKRILKEAKSHYPPVNPQSPRWHIPDDGHQSVTHH